MSLLLERETTDLLPVLILLLAPALAPGFAAGVGHVPALVRLARRPRPLDADRDANQVHVEAALVAEGNAALPPRTRRKDGLALVRPGDLLDALGHPGGRRPGRGRAVDRRRGRRRAARRQRPADAVVGRRLRRRRRRRPARRRVRRAGD